MPKAIPVLVALDDGVPVRRLVLSGLTLGYTLFILKLNIDRRETGWVGLKA